MDEVTVIDQQFNKFHKLNPQVMDRLVALTRQAKRRGRSRIGMKMLFEVIRWNELIRTKGEIFKLNNNYTSRYVRLIEDRYPELVGMFQKRKIR